MEHWHKLFMDTVDTLLNHPGAPHQFWVTIVVLLLGMSWVMGKVGNLLDVPNLGMMSTGMASLAGLGVMLAAMVAAQVYAPQYFGRDMRVQSLIIASLAASVVLVVPLLMAYLRARYMPMLLAWMLGLATAFVLIMLVNTAYAAMATGERSFEKGRAHNEDVEKLIR